MKKEPFPPFPQEAKYLPVISTTINAVLKKYRCVIPEDMAMQLFEQQLKGVTKIQINRFYIDEFEKRLVALKAEEKKLKQCAERNNKGKEYEKAGMIKKAIAIYEKNISGDCYPAAHSFNRLMVIYRQQKEYEKEITVIEKAIEVLCVDNPEQKTRLVDRLEKVKKIQVKNKL